MFQAGIDALGSVLTDHPWVSEVAGILPLSALIDFINIPLKLHVFQLVGGVPLWSWPITPAASRLLLSDDDSSRSQPCCLDRIGASVSLIGLDGRYGDEYLLSSPETFRLAIASQHSIHEIKNLHGNMKDANLRVQNLDIIYIRRTANPLAQVLALIPGNMHSVVFLATSFAGWAILLGGMVTTVIFRFYIATAFLAAMPATGLVVHALYGTRPKRLLVDTFSAYNRLIVVSEHMNSTDWTIVYGESTIVNSLVNRPLDPTGPDIRSWAASSLLRQALRLLILVQWACAVGAAATKDWNSYFISFWIVFCIFSHAYILTPTRQVGDWLQSFANLELRRYQTRVSSRHALLNTLVTLNPDTFADEVRTIRQLPAKDMTRFFQQALSWIDPILKPSDERTNWEAATLRALNDVSEYSLADRTSKVFQGQAASYLSAEWHNNYKDVDGKDMYWKKDIAEGIYMAANISEKWRSTLGDTPRIPA